MDKSEYAKAYREKNREKVAAYNAKWKTEHPDLVKQYAARWREENRGIRNQKARDRYQQKRAVFDAFINNYKVERGCIRCGYRDSAVALDLHHRDGEQKLLQVSGMAQRDLGLVREEVEKCDVICANCHRILHHEPQTF